MVSRSAPTPAPADPGAPVHPSLWNVLAPAADPRDPLAGLNLCSAPPAGAVALEIAAEPDRLRLLARAWEAAAGDALAAGVYAAFPQARLVAVAPDDDPARPAADSVRFDVELLLRDPEYFPLRTYERDAAERQGDPLAVLVCAMQAVGPGERVLLRLTLAPAPGGWARRYRPLLHAARRADEAGQVMPLADGRARAGGGGATDSLGFLLLLGALALGLWAWPAVAAIRAGQRPPGPLGLVPWEGLFRLHPALLALTDLIIRAARLVLVLDERQPDALRAEAITMPAARLCWTLTQLDGGLPLEICQALVRAIRLGRGRRPVTDPAEATSAEPASTAAARWLRSRWPDVAAMMPIDWLGAITVAPMRPSEVVVSRLDGPLVVGPPPGTVPAPLPGLRDLAWLAAAFADGVADVLRGLALRR